MGSATLNRSSLVHLLRWIQTVSRVPQAVRFFLVLSPAALIGIVSGFKSVELGQEVYSRQVRFAGEHIALSTVFDGIGLLRKHRVDYYSSSNEFSKNALLQQRTYEGAWPIRPTPSSKYKLGLIGEKIDGCVILDSTTSVTLHVCE
jgi:hypothetical protein